MVMVSWNINKQKPSATLDAPHGCQTSRAVRWAPPLYRCSCLVENTNMYFLYHHLKPIRSIRYFTKVSQNKQSSNRLTNVSADLLSDSSNTAEHTLDLVIRYAIWFILSGNLPFHSLRCMWLYHLRSTNYIYISM